MKPNSQDRWNRLVTLARLAPQSAPARVDVPFGFVTRVAARGLAAVEKGGLAGLFEPMALRALGIAAIAAVAVSAFGYNPVVQTLQEEIAAVGADPVSVVVD